MRVLECEQRGESAPFFAFEWRKLLPLNVNAQQHPSIWYRSEAYLDVFRCKRYRASEPYLP